MRGTRMYFPTLREVPAEAEMASHKLLLRGGFIRKVSSGIYDYLPLGYKVVKKIEKILREELDKQDAMEILMPALVTADLYKETGRYDLDVLFKLKDRKDAEYAIGFTHEEIVTDIIRKDVKSYKELPINLYQIQTKGRDEARPRGGLLRTREFIMMDAYSFDKDWDGLDISYDKMYKAFARTFERCGISPKAVSADSGAIGGKDNQEFMLICDQGEDTIVVCPKCGYAANSEKCEVGERPKEIKEELKDLELVPTPDAKTIEQVASFLKISPKKLVKTLIFKGKNGVYAFLIRGDRELNEAKAARVVGEKSIEAAEFDLVEKVTNAPVGFAGPVGGLGVDKVVCDNDIKNIANFVVGGNKADHHYINVNLNRDFTPDVYEDIVVARKGDGCAFCDGTLSEEKGMEVGHIFKLGTVYSETMNAKFLDDDGKEKPFIMGCYGMGVSRMPASIVEAYNDKDGIIWPISIAPFEVVITLVNSGDDKQCEFATRIYEECLLNGIDVLLDDREERPGVKFKDSDLMGVPIQVVVGKGVKDNNVEICLRRDKQKENVNIEDAFEYIKSKRAMLYNELEEKANRF